MTLKLPLWSIIPALALFTLLYFLAFEGYTINQWINGNGIVAMGIGLVYLSEGIYKKVKNGE